MADFIRIQGAREHNLQDVSLEIPREKLIVFTGLSGSGKSSLAFDTIYAEGQRRYVESLSAYARQFLGLMEKPDVDQIDGLSPAISIDQKSTSRNPRSTVATVTEIYDYLRLLFARIGIPHGPDGEPISNMTLQEVVDAVRGEMPANSKLMVLAPIVLQKKGQFEHIPEQFSRAGFARARVDGIVYSLDEFPTLEKQKKHDIEIIVDRVVNKDDMQGRISQSVEQALELGDGKITIVNADKKTDHNFSQRYYNVKYPDFQVPDLEPRTFSFNSPQGACPTCTGLGSRLEVDPDMILNPNLTVAEGGVRPWNRVRIDTWYVKKVDAMAQAHGFDVHTKIEDLNEDQLKKLLRGTGEQKFWVELGSGRKYEATFEGVIPNLERRHTESDSEFIRKDIERFMQEKPCHACEGKRLKDEVLAITVANSSIVDIAEMSITDALNFFDKLKLNKRDSHIADQVVKEINNRLGFLRDVGLDYLTLSRSAKTLSGGEAQRIRLATQIGSGLQGVLYVLDEPSIGLHQRDNNKLIKTLKNMRDLGNTVIVVEHDEETIRSADFLVDIGPGAGAHGGKIIATGTPAAVAKQGNSMTAKYLNGKEKIATPKKRRKGTDKELKVFGAQENNLKSIDVSFPLGKLTVVSGVSGSGKSSLVNDIVAKELKHRLHRANAVSGKHQKIEGIQYLDKSIIIDQSAIGRTPRSNPATYTGVFTPIRELFASTQEAQVRGYKAGRFSFNVKGGRCENCTGDGIIKIEMHFLPDVYVQCEVCKGKRYNREALEIHYKGKTISDILEMTVEGALDFFVNQPAIKRKIQTLNDVGLGYIHLGQPATTLSGGEAQRIKLASELSRRATGRTLYILDEPTTGLHMHDVKKLLEVLHKLVEGGNSMIVIEHNLDVVKSADWIIDMGPDGGDAGGTLLAEGTPEQVAKNTKSYTGQYLKEIL